ILAMSTIGFLKYEEQMGKKIEESKYSVILDTSFMIRLLSVYEPLHPNALGYFQYFLENEIPMYFSTISIAEYCVKGDYEDLPFQNIRILPFNILHAKEAGKFANTLFVARNNGLIQFPDRLIIPNDSKIFAQGAFEKNIRYFVTSDTKSKKNIDILRKECGAEIEHLDINIPYDKAFGVLDFS
ncbi:MAG: hypothetical protein K2N16_05035, partial [Muribaculaceae bacterium]|nr:hypothetical protein [Muribaculaceae bacterium]